MSAEFDKRPSPNTNNSAVDRSQNRVNLTHESSDFDLSITSVATGTGLVGAVYCASIGIQTNDPILIGIGAIFGTVGIGAFIAGVRAN